MLLLRVWLTLTGKSAADAHADDVWRMPHHSTPERTAANAIVIDAISAAMKRSGKSFDKEKASVLLCAMQVSLEL